MVICTSAGLTVTLGSLNAEQDGDLEVKFEVELGIPAVLENVPSPQKKALEAELDYSCRVSGGSTCPGK